MWLFKKKEILIVCVYKMQSIWSYIKGQSQTIALLLEQCPLLQEREGCNYGVGMDNLQAKQHNHYHSHIVRSQPLGCIAFT